MKKILFYPGAFNPPHLGHAAAVKNAVEGIAFDEVWIMPSGKRDDKDIETEFEDRYNLGNLFIEYLQSIINIPIKLITDELDQKGELYTHEIMEKIKSQPNVEIFQLIGTDGFANLYNKIGGGLLKEKFIVMTRQGYLLPEGFVPHKNVILVDAEDLGISSTQIRKMLHENDPEYKRLVPQKIGEYLESHKLY